MSLELKDLLIEKPVTLIFWEIENNFETIVSFFQNETEVKKLEDFEDFQEWVNFVEVRYLVLACKNLERLEEIKKVIDKLDIEKRRKLFIIFISPHLETLDRKKSFLYGVNLVVNERDIKDLDKILSKAKTYWEVLYKAYFTTLEKLIER